MDEAQKRFAREDRKRVRTYGRMMGHTRKRREKLSDVDGWREEESGAEYFDVHSFDIVVLYH